MCDMDEKSISSKDIQIQELKSELEEYRNPLIKCMEQEYKKHKKYDFELYCSCKEKCENYEIKELLYVKAALELKKKSNADYSGLSSSFMVLISNIIMVLTMWYGLLKTDKLSDIKVLFNSAIIFGLCYIFCNVIIIVLNLCTNRYYKKYIFFYSIVCDVIEEKIRKEK